jgi:chemotaxis family two-component system response regulator Rcp1
MVNKPGQDVVRILIVEDNRGDALLVREALKESNLRFELTHISDGEKAFDYLRRRGEHLNADRPHLVLLDLNLPKRDGWEVLDEIRVTPDLERTPVVILSSSGNPADRERAARTPNSLYIRKPSTLDEFLAVGQQIESFWAGAHGGESHGQEII